MAVIGGKNCKVTTRETHRCDDSSESENESEPAKVFVRKISTKQSVSALPATKEGFLMKQTWSFQRWRRRFFRLRGRVLYYAKDRELAAGKGVHCITMVSSMWKGIFLIVFILPDVTLCTKTGRQNFIVDRDGIRRYTGRLPGGRRLPEKLYPQNRAGEVIPTSFDVREAWPQCINITGYIRNQKNCGSCWAFAAAEVISDRICIKSNGLTQVIISPEDIVSCCKSGFCAGCRGGYENEALQYWVHHGVVTGGDLNSHEGCRPYTIDQNWNKCETPSCKKTCEKGEYATSKYYGSEAYSVPADEHHIKREILKNGPVTASFDSSGDFKSHSSGVYRHPTPVNATSDHAIKILGWGVEDGLPYWLCANSWGAVWGEKGYFKILRGDQNNNCKIEKSVHAGLPKL